MDNLKFQTIFTHVCNLCKYPKTRISRKRRKTRVMHKRVYTSTFFLRYMQSDNWKAERYDSFSCRYISREKINSRRKLSDNDCSRASEELGKW